MFGQRFYNESTRRYVAVFGTLFNDIQIGRKNSAGVEIQRMTVPVNYAPKQKILARLEGDPNLDQPAIVLPRISFELTGMTYNPTRKLPSLTRQTKSISGDKNSFTELYSPAPYDLDFQLNIMTKYTEDGTKILEQIVPFFKPDVTVSVEIIDTMELYVDIPVVLNSVTTEDSYESDFQTRRVLTWTLNFSMKAYYFGPTTPKKVIKFVAANTRLGTAQNSSLAEVVTVKPGSKGTDEENFATPWPSDLKDTDPNYANRSRTYTDKHIDDDWQHIVQISDA